MLISQDIETDNDELNCSPSVSILDTDHIYALLVKLSLPAMITGVISSLYNIINSILVGQFLGTNFLSVLAISVSVQILLFSVAALFSVGTGTLLSQALGAQNFVKVRKVLYSGISASVIFGIILSIIMVGLLPYILDFIKVPKEIYQYTYSYLLVILAFSFIILINAVLSSILRASGHPKTVMVISVTTSIINIIFDFCVLSFTSWGIPGIAFALILSQFTAFVGFCYSVSKINFISEFHFEFFNIDFSVLKKIVLVGLSSGVRMVLLSISILIANQVLQSYGIEALAAFGIVNKMISFAFMPIQGCNFGFQPIVSFNLGAQRLDRIRKALYASIGSAVIVGILGTILFVMAPMGIFSLFSNDTVTISLARQASRYMGSLFCIYGGYLILVGFIQAVGFVKYSLLLAFLRPLSSVLLYLLLPKFLGLTGIWIVLPVSDILNIIIASILSLNVYWKIKQQMDSKKIDIE
ncbi:MAG: MATE family efflux transporter [Brevinemataceae bacterium]